MLNEINKMKITIQSVAIFFVMGAISFAGVLEGSYGDGGDYLFELSHDAAAQGRGGGTAAKSGTEAMYHNPGAIGLTKYRELSVGRQILEDFNFNSISYVNPTDKFGAFGLAFYGIGPNKPVEIVNQFGESDGYESGGHRTITLGYAYQLWHKLSFGGAFKISNQDIGGESGLGVGFDAGAQYAFTEDITMGVSLINVLGPSITLDVNEDVFASVMKFGLGMKLLQDKLFVNLDADLTNIIPSEDLNGESRSIGMRYRAGLEYTPIQWAALRMGINDRFLSAGFGAQTNNIEFSYAFSFVLSGDAGIGVKPAHYLSVNVKFGKPPEQQKRDLLDKIDSIKQYDDLNLAREKFINGEYDISYRLVTRYLEKYPNDTKVERFQKKVIKKLNRSRLGDLEKLYEKYVVNHPADTLIILREEVDKLMKLDQKNEEIRKMDQLVKAEENVKEILVLIENYQFDVAESRLKAILLVYPNIASANSAYKLLKEIKEIVK